MGLRFWAGCTSLDGSPKHTHTVAKDTIPGLNQSEGEIKRKRREMGREGKKDRGREREGWARSLFFHRLLILLLACQETVTESRPL